MADATQLQAGIAPVTITPDRPLLLEGYGSRQGPATGTLDEVEAQALVLDDGSTRAAIVAADLCGFESESAERIRVAAQASGVPGENIMITYSHSHSAPLVTPFAAEVVDGEYLAWMEQTIAEAIIAASRRLAPVTLGVGTGEVNFTVNRRVRTAAGTVMRANPVGLADRRVRVLRLDRADAPAAAGTLGDTPLPSADPVAILFSYATHPGVLRDESYLYSGEYPACGAAHGRGHVRRQRRGRRPTGAVPAGVLRQSATTPARARRRLPLRYTARVDRVGSDARERGRAGRRAHRRSAGEQYRHGAADGVSAV